MSKEPRIPILSAENVPEPWDALNIGRTVAHNPELLKAWSVFALHIMGPTSTLDPRERELAILRVAWNHQANYEWGHHVQIAKTIGITDKEIASIPQGDKADIWQPLEKLLMRAADELYADSTINQQTWDGLAQYYSKQQRLDLIFTIGQYTLVSYALNSLKVQLEDGIDGLPKVE